MPKKVTTKDFIEQASNKHNGKYSYEKAVYSGAHEKLTITCPQHGDFNQRAADHKKGKGCSSCKIEKLTGNINEFITKATARHNNKYDYSKTTYKNSRSKVIITCPVHGDFEQTAKVHLEGSGCTKCGHDSIRSNQEIFLSRSAVIHSNKYNYSKTTYIGSLDKVIITCPEHGDFKQTPSGHLTGRGCAKCFHDSWTSNTEEFIVKSMLVHGNYQYDKTIYRKAIEKVTITCLKHGNFEQTPNNHLNGYGCTICARENSRSNTATFIRKAIACHGDKYSYDKVTYIGSQDKVTIICPEHGVFTQSPSSHIMGVACPSCNYDRTDAASTFITRSNRIHDSKYSYDKVEYKGTLKKVTIICPDHGEFQLEPGHHMRGVACAICSNERSRGTTADFIERASLIHENRYTYSNSIYIKSDELVIITCPVHGDFSQAPSSHLSGRACSKCNVTGGYSKTAAMRGDYAGTTINIYWIKMYAENELFYKIGLSSNTVEVRNPGRGVYEWAEVDVINNVDRTVGVLFEQFIHCENIEFRSLDYVPEKTFGGDTECYSDVPKYWTLKKAFNDFNDANSEYINANHLMVD